MFNKILSYGFFGIISSNSNSETVAAALTLIGALICIIAPYLLGSMNFAIIISKAKYGSDIRNHGSKNAGMTNMMRTYGKSAAALTLGGDALKAIISGVIGYVTIGMYGAYIAGMFCILGHMFPVYYKFKGGKGVVTAYASILMCDPVVFLVLLLIFVIIVAFTKYISLGSVMCMLIYPVILDRMHKFFNGVTGPYVIIAILNAALIIFMHRENIKRLLKGNESKFSFKKSEKKNKDGNNE
jgi:glycerol-3-phosphate acyltransferase PlsY